VVCEGERITAVHTVSTCYWPGLVVLTAGAWSGGLAESLGLDLPTQPIKGQLLQADCRVSDSHAFACRQCASHAATGWQSRARCHGGRSRLR
jgi:glycine/D-amino acid oxidase-like deaminating enzyme